jgi:hypothetical protein
MKSRRGFKNIVLFLMCGASMAVCQVGGTPGTPDVWGGPHVSIVTSEKNVTLEFDCAEGIILNEIKPDADGNFSAEGTYTPQRGGPVKKDSPLNDLPAIYKGTIHGNTMQLQVVLANQDQRPPPLTLTRGQAGRVVKCR